MPPTTPKNSLQLLQWLIFEPVLFKRYDNSLNKTQTAIMVLKAVIVNFFIVIIPLTLVLYAIALSIIAAFDLLLIFPPDASCNNIGSNEVFVQQWQTYSTWWEKAYFFASFENYKIFKYLAIGLTIGLAVGLAIGLAVGLALDLAEGLAIGLAFSLAIGLAVGLAEGLTVGLAVGLAFSLALGLAFGLIVGLEVSLARTLAIGLAIGLAAGLARGLTFGLALPLFFYLTYFRLWFYPWHILKSLVSISLTNNPYISDGVIWLPIWGITRQLTTQAQNDPKAGLKFSQFLLEYRPLQKQLAMHIAHAATAGNWQHHPLQKQYLLPPPITQKTPGLTPSESWLNQIDQLREQLAAYEKEEQISLKKAQFEIFCTQLDEFRKLTISQAYRWHHYYLPAIDKWQAAAKEELAKLTEELRSKEPIAHNIYRFGDTLDPENDQKIFLGREDIKTELKQQILTACTMPMFLCYGQRRVGKSSLLKFLPRLLGSRFKVVYQDCEHINNLLDWLKDLRQRLDKIWKPSEIDWQASDNWLEAWGKMQRYLENLSHQHEEKIILAFDEYEALHERIFQTDPRQGKMLLEAMRSFSQQQNQVVFLFVGATQFADLKAPDWDRCFIHAMPLQVDYLRRKDAERLITEPVDLNYPDTVIERMWTITQGHPALLQMLCSHLVTIANTERRKDMTIADLEQVISEEIVQLNTYALESFWTEFCAQHQCHATIEQILAKQTVTDKASLLKLEDYGYIIPDGESWKLRMPLLEKWLERYRD
ncbi:MAG: AAA family ATPase [Pseudomonadota bacterium]